MDFLQKGRKGSGAPIGSLKMFGGREYIKTSSGWKYHGKGGGKKATEHRESSQQIDTFEENPSNQQISQPSIRAVNISANKVFESALATSPKNAKIDDLNLFSHKSLSGNQGSPRGNIVGTYTYQEYKDVLDKVGSFYKKNGGVKKALLSAPQKTIQYKDLIPLQQTISPQKVQDKLMGRDNNQTLPVVFKINGKMILEGGTHRTSADILRGNSSGTFAFIDLDEPSQPKQSKGRGKKATEHRELSRQSINLPTEHSTSEQLSLGDKEQEINLEQKKLVDNVKKALSKYGDWNFVVHKTSDDLNKHLKSLIPNSVDVEGFCNTLTNEIHISRDDPNFKHTLYHESLHVVVRNLTDKQRTTLFKKMMSLGETYEKLKNQNYTVEEFMDRYSGGKDQVEEGLTEYFAAIASGELQSKSFIDGVIHVLNGLLKSIGLEEIITKTNIRYVANGLAESLRLGIELEKINQDQEEDGPTADDMLKHPNTKRTLQDLGWGERFLAKTKNYKPDTYYRVEGTGLGYTGAGQGMYVGRDKDALKRFYDLEGEGLKVSEFKGQPKWLNLMDPDTHAKFEMEAKQRYGEDDPSVANHFKKLAQERGYDGIRYYDPYATGEEFVLFDTEKLKKQ